MIDGALNEPYKMYVKHLISEAELHISEQREWQAFVNASNHLGKDKYNDIGRICWTASQTLLESMYAPASYTPIEKMIISTGTSWSETGSGRHGHSVRITVENEGAKVIIGVPLLKQQDSFLLDLPTFGTTDLTVIALKFIVLTGGDSM